jgi:hypothetical protein
VRAIITTDLPPLLLQVAYSVHDTGSDETATLRRKQLGVSPQLGGRELSFSSPLVLSRERGDIITSTPYEN